MVKKSDKNYTCPECQSTETVGAGKYLTKKWGYRPRRKCKKCAHTFYVPIKTKREVDSEKVV